MSLPKNWLATLFLWLPWILDKTLPMTLYEVFTIRNTWSRDDLETGLGPGYDGQSWPQLKVETF